jgi:hypothetical protein
VTVELVRVADMPHLERSAQNVLPPKRAPDDHAQILSGDFGRLETVQPQPRHTTRSVARYDARVAQAIAAKTGGSKGPDEIQFADLRCPDRPAAAGVVWTRRKNGGSSAPGQTAEEFRFVRRTTPSSRQKRARHLAAARGRRLPSPHARSRPLPSSEPAVRLVARSKLSAR